MAPKKKTGRAKEEAPKEPDFDDEIVPEHSREFYLIQIRDLEGRLARYQKKWDELQVSEELFRTEYEKMVNDNREIVAFLKKTLNQRVDEIADLTDQLHLLQQAKDAEKDAFEAQLGQLRHEFQETKDQLTSENMVLSGKLAALEEFRLQKDEIMARFADLEAQLKKQEEDHKEYIYNLEKKAVIDKERLKKEMMHRVNTVAAEFRKVAHSQMAETTKRTIRENVTISFQLTKITEQSLQLIQENDRLKEAHAQALKQLDLLEQNEKLMAKNTLSNQKMIKMLTNKCKEMQGQVNEYAEMKKVMSKTQDTNEELRQENLELREQLDAQKDEVGWKMTEIKRLNKIRQEEQDQKMNAERALRQAAQSLKEVLLERPFEEEVDGDFDVMFQLRRNDALQGILNFLNRSIVRIETCQALRPFSRESTMIRIPSAESSEWRLKASRIMSHCNIFKLPRPRPAHSMPSMSMLSHSRVETLRPYASATEPLVTVWRTETREAAAKPHEENVQKDRSLPDVVAERATHELTEK